MKELFTEMYASPLGAMLLSADSEGLTGLEYTKALATSEKASANPALQAAKKWLDLYFSGTDPKFTPPLHLMGTRFQQEVWELLLKIPYGKLTTYGALAKAIAARQGKGKMSAQAIGGAVGRNPVGIIVPCHRVVGSNGDLTGYASGIEKKGEVAANGGNFHSQQQVYGVRNGDYGMNRRFSLRRKIGFFGVWY